MKQTKAIIILNVLVYRHDLLSWKLSNLTFHAVRIGQLSRFCFEESSNVKVSLKDTIVSDEIPIQDTFNL